MKALIRAVSVPFAGGAIGGLANAAALWAVVTLAIRIKGYGFVPDFPPNWVYPRIVWGGVWGLLFIVPLGNKRPILRGLVLSLVPSACQLLALYPLHVPPGLFGMVLNKFTPIGVVFFNLVWGVVTALWCQRGGR
jgi:hypothetical protein